MAFNVTFNFTDEFGRITQRTWHNTNALIATVLTDITSFVTLYDAVGDGGLDGITITQKSIAENKAAQADTNIDANASVQVVGGDTYRYDFDLPMPDPAIVLAGGAIDLGDANVIAFFDEFLVGSTWRINLRNPTDIVSLAKGELDR